MGLQIIWNIETNVEDWSFHYIFLREGLKCRKVDEQVPGEQHNPASSNHFSILLYSKGLSSGFNTAALSHNPVSYTPHKQQVQNKAEGFLHLSCSSWTCCCRVLNNLKCLEMKSSVSDMVGAPKLVAFRLPSSLSYSIPDGRLNCHRCQLCWFSQGSFTQANILFSNLNRF